MKLLNNSLTHSWNLYKMLLGPMYCFCSQVYFAIKDLLQQSTISDVSFKCLTFSSYYSDVIMGAMASQIISLIIVYSTVYSGADERKHQSSASLAFVRGIDRWPVNSPHKWPVTRNIFPFDDVIMSNCVDGIASRPSFNKKKICKTIHCK